MPPIQPPSGRWWSRSKRVKDKSPSLTCSHLSLPNECDNERRMDPYNKQSSKLSALATVMGLKSKKHTVAIQDPPPNSFKAPYPPDSYVPSRPHSKAVSTTTSDDCAEPMTPSDIRLSYPRPNMTISDPDPFAPSVIVPQHFDAQDPSMLSVLSDPSRSKRSIHSDTTSRYCRSYTSSSSHSHRSVRPSRPSESSLLGPPDLHSTDPTAKAPMVKTGPEDNTAKALTSDSITVKIHNIDAPTPTPSDAKRSARSRGMTDTGPSQRRENLNVPPPLFLARQPSLSRMVLATPNYSLPPSHGLPPVPASGQPDRGPRSAAVVRTPSLSSLSFASSGAEAQDNNPSPQRPSGYTGVDRGRWAAGEVTQRYNTNQDTAPSRNGVERQLSARSSGPFTESHRLLKNAASMHSLYRAEPPADSVPTEGLIGLSDAGHSPLPASPRVPKKQRSFPHPRIPTLRSATPLEAASPIQEKEKERQKEKDKRENASMSARRRLFSGSTRHMNNSLEGDDAGHTPRPSPENDRNVPSFANPFSSPGKESMVLPPAPLDAFPSNVTEDRRPSETQSVDYIPQQIMSPADMLKLEEMMRTDAESFTNTAGGSLKSIDGRGVLEDFGRNPFFRTGRPRRGSFTDSVMSGSTAFSGAFSDGAGTPSSMSFFDQHVLHLGGADSGALTPPLRSESTKSSPPLRLPTSQGTMKHNFSITQDDFQPHSNSLPPPPRPKHTVLLNHENSPHYYDCAPSKRTSVVLIHPLSPPPIRRNKSTPSTRSAVPPPSEQKAPPSSFGSSAQRPSVMKKPSFLEIEDEVEVEMGARNRGDVRRGISSAQENSFLDLGRGGNSFDTIRTMSTDNSSQ